MSLASPIKVALPNGCNRDIDFRELSPKEGKYRLRYNALRHIRYGIRGISALLPPGARMITFHDHAGREWLRIDQYGALLAEGYSWNGCTPKRWTWPIGWWGTPDFECTIAGSGIHDAFYQFHATKDFPLHRSECDEIFKNIIELYGEYDIAHWYHKGVQRFGSWPAVPRDPTLYSVVHY